MNIIISRITNLKNQYKYFFLYLMYIFEHFSLYKFIKWNISNISNVIYNKKIEENTKYIRKWKNMNIFKNLNKTVPYD